MLKFLHSSMQMLLQRIKDRGKIVEFCVHTRVCVCEYITFKARKNCGILHTHMCVCEYITFKAMKHVYNFPRTYVVIF